MQIFHERMAILFAEKQDENPKFKYRDFAEMCGVRETQMHNWLNNAGTPNAKVLKVIAENLDLNVAWLIGLSDDRYNSIDALSSCWANLTSQEVKEMKKYAEFLRYKRPSSK